MSLVSPDLIEIITDLDAYMLKNGYVDCKALSKLFKIGSATPREWVARKKIKSVKVGNKLYFPIDQEYPPDERAQNGKYRRIKPVQIEKLQKEKGEL